MTHLIINNDIELRRKYLLRKVGEYLEKDISKFIQLHKIPDIHLIEKPEMENVKIEEVKQIQKELIFQPFEEKYQIGIICHAHMMTVEAQNAMLKTLEEQGERTLYFLLVNNEKNVLDTIISRSIKHYVKRNSKEDLADLEKSEETADRSLPDEVHEVFELISKKIETKGHQELIALVELITDGSNMNLTQSQRNARRKLKVEALKMLQSNANKQLVLENLYLQVQNLTPQG
jgi:DNA polymerase III delta prime subunit